MTNHIAGWPPPATVLRKGNEEMETLLHSSGVGSVQLTSQNQQD